MGYFFCLFIGACIGVLAMAFLRGSSHDEDCKSCKAYYAAIIRERDDVIHGLKSTRGALAKEVQNLTFLNSGFKAR
jgi:hypothetical protein